MYVIETPTGVVLIDTLRRSTQTKEIIRLLKRLDKPVLGIFITHAHSDHYGGISSLKAFAPNAPVYATAAIVAAIKNDPNGDNVRRREMFGESFPTQETINTNLSNNILKNGDTVTLGGMKIEAAVMGASESPASVVYFLPEVGAVFSGDLINVLTVSAPVESLDEWLKQLNQMESHFGKAAERVYVGHGPDGPFLPLLREERVYLQTLRGLVAAALRGDNKVSDAETESIVQEMAFRYPHYNGAAAIPPRDLLKRSVEWVAKQIAAKGAK